MMNERPRFYWLTIHTYDQDNLRIGDEAVSFCIGLPGIKALYTHMHYPFYEENWPSVESILDDKALRQKCAEQRADMEKRSECFANNACSNDCELVHCSIRAVLRSKTMTAREFAQKTLQQIQRSAVTITDELDLMREGV